MEKEEIRPNIKFVKKTSMSHPVKSLGYIISYSSSSPRYRIALAILSDTTVTRSALDQEVPKSYWKSEKGHISLADQHSYYFQVYQRLY